MISSIIGVACCSAVVQPVVHFLHSSVFGNAPPSGPIVAEYVIHFADGRQETVPVITGTDIADWIIVTPNQEISAGLKGIVWLQPIELFGPVNLALTRQSWKNPKPDQFITRIEFISKGVEAAPFLVGITLE